MKRGKTKERKKASFLNNLKCNITASEQSSFVFVFLMKQRIFKTNKNTPGL